MLPPPDFDALAERMERGRQSASPPLVLLGRACGRLAGAPELEDLARQALAVLAPERKSAPSTTTIGPFRAKELQRAFLSAFPSRDALDQMLSYGLGISLTHLSAEGPLTHAVHQVIDWAQSEGQLDDLIRAATTYNPANPVLAAFKKSQVDESSDAPQATLDEFRERFRDLSSLERYSLLQTIYRRIPVPAFYQELARLVKAGYVRHVLTTNIDSLFEQALESLGLVRDIDFDVIPLGTKTSREALSSLEANRPLVLKMHGDISQGEFGVTPDEIDYAVHRAKRFIKDELQGQATVIVGYEGESGPLNDWLARAPGEVWWVHAEPPQGVTGSTNIRWLQLSPSDLFAALTARLLTLRFAPSPGMRTSDVPRLSIQGSAAIFAPPPPPSEHDLLLQEIERLKAETLALAQPTSAGTPLQRQEEIAQRRRRIRDLEDQLRTLPDSQSAILQLLDRVQQSVVDAEHQTEGAVQIDPATRQYFTVQVNTLRDQYKSGQPNANIVSAALGAALVLAERLGPSVIDPQDVQSLAAFGPTVAGMS